MRRAAVLASMALLLASPTWAGAAVPEDPPGGAARPPTPSQNDADELAGARFTASLFGGYSPSQADGLDSGGGFGGSLAAYFHRHLGVEVGAQRLGLGLVGTEENALSGGDFDATVVTVGLVARFPTGSRLIPFLSGGLAYFINSAEIDPSIRSELASFNFTVDESMDDAAGFNVGGGVTVAVRGSFGVFGEARYMVASGDTTARLTDRISGVSAEATGSQDLHLLTVAAGLRVAF